MALIKFGAGVVQMSGSIAGDVHARNRFGNYIRPRTKPVNPRSQRQMGIRVILMYLAEQWRESPMTDLIRAAWQTYADSVNWTNRLGEAVTLTGFNCFMQCNAARISSGSPITTAAPAALGLPPGDPALVISNADATTQTIDIAFDDDFNWAKEDLGLMLIYQGKPQPASHNFFNGPWRYNSRMTGGTAAPITSPQAAQAVTGFPLVTGQKVWWQARISRADGRISTLFRPDPTIVVSGA